MTSSITDILGPQQSQVGQLSSAQREQVRKILQQIAPTSSTTTAPQPALEELVKPVQQVNETLRSYGVEFELSQHDGRVITRLVERDTGELIRQIPSEALLRISERLGSLQQGSILNEKV